MTIGTMLLIASVGAIVISFVARLLPTDSKTASDVISPGYGSEYRSEAEVRARFMDGKCKRWPYMREIYQVYKTEPALSLLEAAYIVVEQRHGDKLPAEIESALQAERSENSAAVLNGDTIRLNLHDNDFASPIEGTVFDKNVADCPSVGYADRWKE